MGKPEVKPEIRPEVKQKYEAVTLEGYLTKIGNKSATGEMLSAEEKINLALNEMLKGKKIIGTMNRKGLNYFLVEAV
jgi:hypothetical protein